MATDVRDILQVDFDSKEDIVTKESLFGDKKKKIKKNDSTIKRPEGMHRELWGLLNTDNKDGPPLIATDCSLGYKQTKAKIGQSRVRQWRWMPFTNPARKDGAIFYHWRRLADEHLEYPFARFNKTVDVVEYTDMEYQQHLVIEGWTRAETDHLFDLCKKYDLRFIVMQDKWDQDQFGNRTVEDLKERYYDISNILSKLHNPGNDTKLKVFDAQHERKRKEQLRKLLLRTEQQIEEEGKLMQELKKIEQRKKERERKALDLQKLITAADITSDNRRSERKVSKKMHFSKNKDSLAIPESTNIKFPDFKQSGVYLRSQKMKLPLSLGQKKTKAIEQMVEEMGLEINPMPTEKIVYAYNELRQDMLLLYELRVALVGCEYELETLRHRYETIAPNKIKELNNSQTKTEQSMDIT